MGSSRMSPLTDRDRLLQELGRAVVRTKSREPFGYDRIAGTSQVRVYHRGLCVGATMTDHAHLRLLDCLGLIQIDGAVFAVSGTFRLTPSGLMRCAEIVALQAG